MNHIDTTTILFGYEGVFIGIKIINTIKHMYPIDIEKMWNPCYRYMNGIIKKDNIVPTSI